MAKQQKETKLLIPLSPIQIPIDYSMYLKLEKYCKITFRRNFQTMANRTIEQLIVKMIDYILEAEKSEKKDYLEIKDG